MNAKLKSKSVFKKKNNIQPDGFNTFCLSHKTILYLPMVTKKDKD